MKVFVGWPYDATWVDTFIIPLMKSYETYGFEVVTGKELQGQGLTGGVKKLINDSDATLFFTTRRDQPANGSWKTSAWVVDEIKHALSLNKELVFEFREQNVEYDNKIHEERQYFMFAPGEVSQCLVELGKVLNRWRGMNFRVRLTPKKTDSEKFMDEIKKRLKWDKYTCRLQIRQGGTVIYGPKNTTMFKEGDSIVLYTGELPAYTLAPGAVLEVDLEMGDTWSASLESFTTLQIELDKL
jgi:hypothetical protein